MEYDSLEDIYMSITETYELSVERAEVDKHFERDLREFLEKSRSKHIRWGKTVSIHANKDSFSAYFYRSKNSSTSTGGKFKQEVKIKENKLTFNACKALMNHSEWNTLAANINGDCLFLPKLRNVWNQVRDDSPRTARAILSRKDFVQEKQIHVLGITIPQRLISWTMPLLICALSIYFLVHILNLENIAKRNPSICQYPWEVMMPGLLATVVSLTTLAFPVIAYIIIVYATWTGQSTFGQIIFIILFVITTIAIGSTIKKIVIIKRCRGDH
jgi:hypothetical protein